MEQLQKIELVFFRTAIGNEPVRDWLAGLSIENRRAVVLFCSHGGELYALHGFIKKAQKTPPTDLRLARERKKEVENG